MRSPGKGTNSVPGCSVVERRGCDFRSQLKESYMSKMVQHLGRLSRIRRGVMTATLSSALVLVPTVVVAQAPPTRFKVLHTFSGKDGAVAIDDTLTIDKAGMLYGTTLVGGDLNCSVSQGFGCGVAFEMTTTGNEKVLHRFTGSSDGLWPLSPLVQDSNGAWYGTTGFGGDISCPVSSSGCGTVFKIDKTGKETVFYAFTGTNGDGALPVYPLLLDAQGDLYGTTSRGGEFSVGTVFKLDKTGKETIVYSFSGTNGDGQVPYSGLVEDKAGNLYGTTNGGGLTGGACGIAGCGTVYKITKTGTETILYRFTGTNGDGYQPVAHPILGSDGSLYGTTLYGSIGQNGCCGTIYKITKTGKEKVLYQFQGSDGANPWGPLFRDTKGTLYGTTTGGGAYTNGVVFKLTSLGKETLLHSFTGGKDGSVPYAGLIVDSTGNMYGTASAGGDLSCGPGQGAGCGVVFAITK
jgi:uncharacterized repeat protein (TIGR03803 family)